MLDNKAGSSNTYRPDIDGLRAISVLMVIFYHSNITIFSGGYLGVDIFFVISGFLITGIILRESGADNFSLLYFYVRRIKRILPALFFVILCCIPFAYLWLLSSEFDRFTRSIIAVSTFLSNFYFSRFSDYFSTSTDESILVHTWSLAIEEQFYLVFPIIFLAILKYVTNSNARLFIILILCITSLLSAELLSKSIPQINFYLTTSRAWEFLAGAFIALIYHSRKNNPSVIFASMATFSGLVLILVPALFFNENFRHPSLYTLPTILGTLAILLFGNAYSFTSIFLASRFLVFIGLISYSAYLWHQPVFAFYRARTLDSPSIRIELLLIVFILLLAFLTWKFIEKPFRYNTSWTIPKVFAVAIGTSTIFCLLGAIGISEKIRLNRLSSPVILAESYSASNNPRLSECRGQQWDSACVYGSELTNKNIIIWGDSHADQLMSLLDTIGGEIDAEIKELVFPGCPPLLNAEPVNPKDAQCLENSSVFNSILMSDNTDLVILHAYWQSYIDEGNFLINGSMDFDFAEELEKVVLPLINSGKKVLLVGPIPRMPVNPPQYVAKSILFSSKKIPLIMLHEHQNSVIRTINAFSTLSSKLKGVEFFDPADTLCNSSQCLSGNNEILYYRDDSHVSVQGSFLMKDNMQTNIEKLL